MLTNQTLPVATRSKRPTIITFALPGSLMSVHAVVHSIHYLHAASVTAFVPKQADDMGIKPSSRSLYSSEVPAMEHCCAARMMSRAQLEMASMGAGEAWARIAVHCGHEGRVRCASKSAHLYYSVGGCANMLDSSRSNKMQQVVLSLLSLR